MSEADGTRPQARNGRTQPWAYTLALAAAVATAVLLLSVGGAFERLDFALLDRRQRADDLAAATRGDSLSRRVLIVTAPPRDVAEWRAGAAGARRQLAELIRRLDQGQPAAIALDVPLDTPSADDETLARALAASGRVVLRAGINAPRPTQFGIIRPARTLWTAAAGYGYNYWPSSSDGEVRHFSAALEGGYELSLAAVATLVARGRDVEAGRRELVETDRLAGLGPLPAGYRVPLRFRGPPGYGFPTVTLDDLTRRTLDLDGWVVVVGTVDISTGGLTVPLSESWRPQLRDTWAMPMTVTELTATAIDTLLEGHLLRVVQGPALYLLVFGMALTAALAGTYLRRGYAVLAVGLTVLLWLALGHVLYDAVALYLPVGEPVLASLACLVFGIYHRLHHEIRRHREHAAEADRERRRLAELDVAKRVVLSCLVHDLKVPVAIIKGLGLTLASDPDKELGDDLHAEFLDSIVTQCDRLTSMVEDILDADPSREMTVNLEPTDLAELVSRVVEMHEATANRHTFDVAIEPLGAALLDPLKITRVLNNLVSNAVKYSPDGGVVTVRAGLVDDELRVTVEDRGIGMTPAQLGRLFGLFVRVLDDPALIPGTGVGLYASRRVVEAHGGRIEVASTPGEGSRFTLCLPYRPATPAAVAAVAEPA